MRKLIFGLLFFGGICWSLGCNKTPTDFNGQGGTVLTHYVIIKDSSFYPSVLTIAQGNSVTFVNETDHPHALSIDSTHILTDTIPPHRSFYYLNNSFSGALNYYCRIHPNVTGVIVYQP